MQSWGTQQRNHQSQKTTQCARQKTSKMSRSVSPQSSLLCMQSTLQEMSRQPKNDVMSRTQANVSEHPSPFIKVLLAYPSHCHISSRLKGRSETHQSLSLDCNGLMTCAPYSPTRLPNLGLVLSTRSSWTRPSHFGHSNNAASAATLCTCWCLRP